MTHRHAEIAQHRRIGEIALQTGDGQLVSEMPEEGIGQSQIALGVLEVDGVDLVRHGR